MNKENEDLQLQKQIQPATASKKKVLNQIDAAQNKTEGKKQDRLVLQKEREILHYENLKAALAEGDFEEVARLRNKYREENKKMKQFTIDHALGPERGDWLIKKEVCGFKKWDFAENPVEKAKVHYGQLLVTPEKASRLHDLEPPEDVYCPVEDTDEKDLHKATVMMRCDLVKAIDFETAGGAILGKDSRAIQESNNDLLKENKFHN